jgi:hypothetical protein
MCPCLTGKQGRRYYCNVQVLSCPNLQGIPLRIHCSITVYIRSYLAIIYPVHICYICPCLTGLTRQKILLQCKCHPVLISRKFHYIFIHCSCAITAIRSYLAIIYPVIICYICPCLTGLTRQEGRLQ